MISRDAARLHLEALATGPRPAGSPAEGRARAYCARVLADAGLQITEEPFEFSALPGRYATPAFGVAAMGALVVAAVFGWRGAALAALGTLLASVLMMAVLGTWLARHGVTGLRALRRRSVNLIARRGEPAVWLVAHLDSKSQPVPILLRAAGITMTGVVWLAAIGLAITQAVRAETAAGGGAALAGWWPWLAGAGVLAALPIAASFVGERSPGAVDNASGVVTVLLAAQAAGEVPVGVLLTSAEELGLAGARAWARSRPPGIAINCDGVDDAGTLAAMYSGRAPRPLLERFVRAAAAAGVTARHHRLLPGMLVDGVALADAGWQVITITRGTMGTLRRIHTPDDDLRALDGTGVAEAARVMQRMTHDAGAAR